MDAKGYAKHRGSDDPTVRSLRASKAQRLAHPKPVTLAASADLGISRSVYYKRQKSKKETRE